LRTFQPEYALIARESREENRKQLADMLSQIAMERASRLPPPPALTSLETQFQVSVRNGIRDVQRAKDAQSTSILRWLRS
jgi:hypothetical protein